MHKPVAAVVIAEPTVEAALQALEGVEFAEIRLDQLKSVPQSVAPLFSRKIRTIATCRPGFRESDRRALLLEAMKAGASFIDIEYEASLRYRQELVNAARNFGCEVIVSYHNFQNTPRRSVLERIIRACFSRGANLAKIACTVNNPQEAARLMGLLDSKRRLVVIGMGEQPSGLCTRLGGPFFGGEFTFVARYGSRRTAPGQIDQQTLDFLWKQMLQAVPDPGDGQKQAEAEFSG